MWSQPGPAMESHLGNIVVLDAAQTFRFPLLSLSFLEMSPGIWGVYSALAAKGREGSNLQSTLMPSMPCCGQSGPPLPTLAIAELWLLLFWGSETLAPIPVVHGCTFMCVPQFYPHVIHSDSKPLKVDPLLSQHFHIPSGAHGNLCRQWGARTYILGSCILTYLAVSPVKLLQGHTGSNFSWSTDCPWGCNLPHSVTRRINNSLDICMLL